MPSYSWSSSVSPAPFPPEVPLCYAYLFKTTTQPRYPNQLIRSDYFPPWKLLLYLNSFSHLSSDPRWMDSTFWNSTSNRPPPSNQLEDYSTPLISQVSWLLFLIHYYLSPSFSHSWLLVARVSPHNNNQLYSQSQPPLHFHNLRQLHSNSYSST